MPLTDAQIKALKPIAGKRYSRAEGGGLLLDVTPGGVRSWVFRYRLDGKREKVIIGHYPAVSLKEARAERDKLAAMVRAGKSPFQERRLKRAGISSDPILKDFGDRYVESGKSSAIISKVERILPSVPCADADSTANSSSPALNFAYRQLHSGLPQYAQN